MAEGSSNIGENDQYSFGPLFLPDDQSTYSSSWTQLLPKERSEDTDPHIILRLLESGLDSEAHTLKFKAAFSLLRMLVHHPDENVLMNIIRKFIVTKYGNDRKKYVLLIRDCDGLTQMFSQLTRAKSMLIPVLTDLQVD